jgi:hypothetical protein
MNEEGITNLGPVPDGMSFWEATQYMREKRKYIINPDNNSRRMTICETMREIYREASGSAPDWHKITELAATGFDYGKRMDARIKELKR